MALGDTGRVREGVLSSYSASVKDEVLRPSVAFPYSQNHECDWAFLNKMRSRTRLMDWLAWGQTEPHTCMEKLIPEDSEEEGKKLTGITRKVWVLTDQVLEPSPLRACQTPGQLLTDSSYTATEVILEGVTSETRVWKMHSFLKTLP